MDVKDFSAIRNNGSLPDPKTVCMVEILEDMWETYRDAVKSLLSELEAAAMALEADENVEENAALIRRVLHSIKGDSGMTGMVDVHNLCHEAETVFEETTNKKDAADMVLKVKDWIEAVIEHISNSNLLEDKQKQSDQVKSKPRLKALIVDDDQVCRERLQKTLSDFFDCDFAVDGNQGLEMYISSRQNHPYDFITLDINMPGMNGHQTLDAIRQYEDEHGIKGLDGVKVIMLTSEDSSSHVFKAFREGCEAYVIKANMGKNLLDEITKLGLLKVVKVEKDYAVN